MYHILHSVPGWVSILSSQRHTHRSQMTVNHNFKIHRSPISYSYVEACQSRTLSVKNQVKPLSTRSSTRVSIRALIRDQYRHAHPTIFLQCVHHTQNKGWSKFWHWLRIELTWAMTSALLQPPCVEILPLAVYRVLCTVIKETAFLYISKGTDKPCSSVCLLNAVNEFIQERTSSIAVTFRFT